jgi:N6-L-threonylcarbamoyladenine synthase
MAGKWSLPNEALVLAIETSCDETAAAVVTAGGLVRASVVASQDELHAMFGGVVPEIASRRHTELITAVVEQALREAGVGAHDLALLAVTNGPGLIGSLVVGVAAAKAYALAWQRPLVAVNHVEAHMAAAWLHAPGEGPPPRAYPALCLVVSGGHTDLVLLRSPGAYELLGCTRDDAAGEVLDKAGRMLDLGYPGGPAVERVAAQGNPHAVRFTLPHLPPYEFSFAGLKTALAREVEARRPLSSAAQADLAASFQEAVVQTLWRTTQAAAARLRPRQVVVTGGVAANQRLRAVFAQAWQQGFELRIPPRQYCTDNAAMVALAGAEKYQRCGPSGLGFDVFSALPLS